MERAQEIIRSLRDCEFAHGADPEEAGDGPHAESAGEDSHRRHRH
jgi:hypothetical protein